MKKNIKQEIKEFLNLCLICGVGIAVVFHLNSVFAGSNNERQTENQDFSAKSDSVHTVIQKQIQNQKTR